MVAENISAFPENGLLKKNKKTRTKQKQTNKQTNKKHTFSYYFSLALPFTIHPIFAQKNNINTHPTKINIKIFFSILHGLGKFAWCIPTNRGHTVSIPWNVFKCIQNTLYSLGFTAMFLTCTCYLLNNLLPLKAKITGFTKHQKYQTMYHVPYLDTVSREFQDFGEMGTLLISNIYYSWRLPSVQLVPMLPTGCCYIAAYVLENKNQNIMPYFTIVPFIPCNVSDLLLFIVHSFFCIAL